MAIRDQQKVRLSAVAGRFYEGDALALRRRMAETEAELRLPAADSAGAAAFHGCILPHAGYLFSLKTAMATLAAARGGAYDAVVLLGPPHYHGFSGVAASTFGRWRTPFGDLSTATELLAALEQAGDPALVIRDDVHTPEHSLEVQFPLIQYLLGTVPVLPLLVGSMSLASTRAFARTLAGIDNGRLLYLISSDFTHYGENFRFRPFGEPVKEQLRALDDEGLKFLTDRDLNGFVQFLGRTGATICGAQAIALYLALLEELDPERQVFSGEVISRSDSGETTGSYDCVVDYAGVRFSRR